MKNVIIITPYFPPSTLAGVHRARHMAKHLDKFEWKSHVLTIDPKYHVETLDHDLARLVPKTVNVENVPAISSKLARRFGVGDISIRGYVHLRASLDRAIKRIKPDLVFITGAPFYNLLMAGRVRRKHGIPVILDLQDPWVSEEGAAHSVYSRRGASHLLAKYFEPKAVKHASAITSVSDVQNAQMRDRYPFLKDTPFAGIPIGGDPEDFESVGSISPSDRMHALDRTKVNLCFVGTFMPRSGPLMEVVFRAVHRVARDVPGLRSRLRLNFVGTSNQTTELTSGPATRLASQIGIADMVEETTKRVPFLEALAILREANALLMVGSDEQHYTASKIYPNLMSQTPYISLFHELSSAHKILTMAGGGASFAFSSAETMRALEEPIARAIVKLIDEPSSFGQSDKSAYADVTAEAVSARFAKLFDQVVSAA